MTNDYIPTTREVKEFWSEPLSPSGYFEYSPTRAADFNRWLEQHDNAVRQDEQNKMQAEIANGSLGLFWVED